MALADVSIGLPADVDIFDRIAMSGGSCEAPVEALQPYAPGARVAATPWRPPQDDEVSGFTARGPSERRAASTVRLIRLGEDDLEGFSVLRQALDRGYPLETVARVAESEISRAAAVALEKRLQRLVGWRCVKPLGISCKLPGLVTSTTHSRTAQRVGLHVDDFFGPDVEGRATRPVRLAVNLGIEPRYFLFVGLTIEGMPRATKAATANGVASHFLRSWPEFPVTRIKVMPGEAYVAPTENLIHDGTTRERTSVDVCLTFLGSCNEG